MCVCVTYSDEIALGSDGTELFLDLGEVQSTDVPVDPHDTFKFSIYQTLCKQLSELLQQQGTTHYTTWLIQPTWLTVIMGW